MDSYIDFKKDMRAQTSETTLASITEELGHVESELRKGEEELVEFQRSNSVVFLQEQGNSASAYLSKLNVELADKRTEYQLLSMLTLEQNLERQEKQGSSGNGGDENTDLQTDPTDYLHAKQQIQLLKALQQELGEFLRPKHPKMVKLAEDIAQRRRSCSEFSGSKARNKLSSRRDSIGLQITNLDAEVKEWEVKSLDTSEKMAEFQKIQIEQSSVSRAFMTACSRRCRPWTSTRKSARTL